MMNERIKISKEGKRVYSSNPTDFFFHSDWDTLKIFKTGKYTIKKDLKDSFEGDVREIEHNLGYVPYFLVYYTDNMTREGYPPAGSKALINLRLYGSGQVVADSNKLRIRVTPEIDGGGPVDITIEYIIFVNSLDDNKTIGEEYYMFKVGTFTSNASTGDQSITGVGFTPKEVTFTYEGGSVTTRIQGGGGATDGTTQFAHFIATDLVSMSTKDITNGCIVRTNKDNTVLSQATFVSFDSDGFTINWSAASAETWGYEAYG